MIYFIFKEIWILNRCYLNLIDIKNIKKENLPKNYIHSFSHCLYNKNRPNGDIQILLVSLDDIDKYLNSYDIVDKTYKKYFNKYLETNCPEISLLINIEMI